MNDNLLSLIESFAGRKILVIGEAMLDSYLEGKTDRLSREAPVPVVEVEERVYMPGGAANTAVNISALGARAVFLSVTGDDAEGDLLRHALEDCGVSTAHVLSHPHRLTLAKQRIVASGHMLVRFDQGSTHPVERQIEQELIRRMEALYPVSDAVIISDYAYGVLTPNLIAVLRRLQQRSPRLLVVDSKRPQIYRELGVTAVKPNYTEACQLLGLTPAEDDQERVSQVEDAGERILELTGAQIAAVTLDHHGALFFQRGGERPYRTYATPEPNSKAAGAGDTFVSVLALSLAAGAHLENAAELSSAAASIVVSKERTATCSSEELRSSFTIGDKFIDDVFHLAARVAFYRRAGRKVIFTNGCFDILHRGHITYLNRAKSLGDVLIVGLNSDDSVRRLKGMNRPINSLEDRAQILAALSCVDLIVSFDNDTPTELIRIIRPDVFVKGGDYTRDTLPEAPLVEELGGAVEILPYLANHSTTSMIERIRSVDAGFRRLPAEKTRGMD